MLYSFGALLPLEKSLLALEANAMHQLYSNLVAPAAKDEHFVYFTVDLAYAWVDIDAR